jgi:hypothetical protein
MGCWDCASCPIDEYIGPLYFQCIRPFASEPFVCEIFHFCPTLHEDRYVIFQNRSSILSEAMANHTPSLRQVSGELSR